LVPRVEDRWAGFCRGYAEGSVRLPGGEQDCGRHCLAVVARAGLRVSEGLVGACVAEPQFAIGCIDAGLHKGESEAEPGPGSGSV
jgi:hypothetical protein